MDVLNRRVASSWWVLAIWSTWCWSRLFIAVLAQTLLDWRDAHYLFARCSNLTATSRLARSCGNSSGLRLVTHPSVVSEWAPRGSLLVTRMLSEHWLLILLKDLAWATWILLERRMSLVVRHWASYSSSKRRREVVCMVVAIVGARANCSRSAPALISGDSPLVICRRVVLLDACVDHHFIFRHLAVCLIDSQLLMDAALVRSIIATGSSVLVWNHHYSWALITENAAIIVQIWIALVAQVAVPVLVLFWAAQLLMLLMHLHDLHDWLLHLDLLADREAAWVSLVSRCCLMIWNPQGLRLVLSLFNIIIVKRRHIVLALLVNLIVILLLRRWELVHVDVGPIQEGVWMCARSFLLAQVATNFLAGTVLLMSRLILKILHMLAICVFNLWWHTFFT